MMSARGLRGTYMDIPTEDIERLRREAFFASLQDGFELLGPDGTILEVNERFAESSADLGRRSSVFAPRSRGGRPRGHNARRCRRRCATWPAAGRVSST